MNIEKELKTAKQTNFDSHTSNEIISEVKLLLDSEASEDLRIANALGKYHSLAVAQQKVGIQIELNELDDKYAGNVYKIEDIKKLCIKYHLRFLESKYFAGHLDVSAIHKIKEFSKETNTVISDGALSYNFFILAPDESFNLKQVRMPRKSDDPAIFYKIDSEHFRLIHKWGSDFTILRIWKGLMWKSLNMRYWVYFLLWAILISGAVLLLPITKWLCFCSALAFIISAINCRKFYDATYPEQLCSPKTWDREHRLY